MNEHELADLMTRASETLPVDVERLIAGGAAAGRRRVRRRRVAAGVGGLALVAVLGVVATVVPHGGGTPVAVEPAGQPSGTAPTPAAPSRLPLANASGRFVVGGPAGDKPMPPGALDQAHATYTAAPDAALTLHNDAIHAALAALLPAGQVGPILTSADYTPRDKGKNRILHFTYNRAIVSFVIEPAKGFETCESLAANASPSAGYGACQTIGDTQVLTETETGPMALNAAMVWHHGYEITIISYDSGPASTSNPALDGKKLETVADHPPLDLPTLVAAASSNAWFS